MLKAVLTATARWLLPPRPPNGGIALAALLSGAFVVVLGFGAVPGSSTLQPVPADPSTAEPVAAAASCPDTRVSPSRAVVGLSDVHPSFEVTSTRCPVSHWLLSWPAAGVQASSSATRVTVVAAGLTNADAGTSTATATLTLPDSSRAVVALPMVLRRRSTWGPLSATPEPARAGGSIKLRSTLGRADWDDGAYHGYAGQRVQVLFRPAGAVHFDLYATGVTGAGGRFLIKVPAGRSGAWQLRYAGNQASGPARVTVGPAGP
jgi:hypothetical protein